MHPRNRKKIKIKKSRETKERRIWDRRESSA